MSKTTERTIKSPIGALAVVVRHGELVAVRWPDLATRAARPNTPYRPGRPERDPFPYWPHIGTRAGAKPGGGSSTRMGQGEDPSAVLADEAAGQLDEYFAGRRRRFELPLAPAGTPFERAVWHLVAQIPYGETRTYGELARELGRPTAARAVGRAVGLNPLPVVVPCHRVVGAGGRLTGYAGGLPAKAALLRLEAEAPQ